jgi:hypothetical protein
VGAAIACPFGKGYDNPLCDTDPGGMQTYAKAYPGVKNLAIAKGMKGQGIAASICPAQLQNKTNADGTAAQDYGYRPAVNAIIDRLKQVIASECLPRALAPDPLTGQVSCIVVEAHAPEGQACACTGADRTKVANADAAAQAKAELLELGLPEDSCLCEIQQSKGADLTACETQAGAPTDANGQLVNGWCYVDPSIAPASARAVQQALVQGCPSTEQRQIRFVGAGQSAAGAITFITCEGT